MYFLDRLSTVFTYICSIFRLFYKLISIYIIINALYSTSSTVEMLKNCMEKLISEVSGEVAVCGLPQWPTKWVTAVHFTQENNANTKLRSFCIGRRWRISRRIAPDTVTSYHWEARVLKNWLNWSRFAERAVRRRVRVPCRHKVNKMYVLF